jgi:hypothetical protein
MRDVIQGDDPAVRCRNHEITDFTRFGSQIRRGRVDCAPQQTCRCALSGTLFTVKGEHWVRPTRPQRPDKPRDDQVSILIVVDRDQFAKLCKRTAGCR